MLSVVINEFSRNIIEGCRIPTITIYDNPKDFPGKFVARLFDSNPTKYVVVRDSLEAIRKAIPFGMVVFDRSVGDDSVIVETYI